MRVEMELKDVSQEALRVLYGGDPAPPMWNVDLSFRSKARAGQTRTQTLLRKRSASPRWVWRMRCGRKVLKGTLVQTITLYGVQNLST